MRKISALLTAILLLLSNEGEAKETIKLLILSGRNNHNWEQTTQQLEAIFSGCNLFYYQITLRPDTLKSKDLKEFDVVLNNWNSWPDNEMRMPEKTEQALSQFIKGGGGFVTFHASTSAFYEWPEFKKFTTAAWVMDQTNHGKPSTVEVHVTDQKHPVTRGIAGFNIFDELWIDAEVNPDFKILGTATNAKLKEEGIAEQPVIMVSKYGKGNVFHTTLGHDARAMRNTGFKQLLLRGTEWAATGKVTQDLAQELNSQIVSTPHYKWQETDTSVALLNGKHIIWQYNYNTKHGSPFFHPVFTGRNNMTCLSPDDHPWHLGQWFCWKYINKVNYWEYHRGPFQSEGITEIEKIKIKKSADYSAEIELELVYHPYEGKNVLAEKRVIRISPPQPDGKLWMDYYYTFEALADEVELNRTPVLGQENGKSWGGYSGLSIRFSQDFTNSFFIKSWEGNDNVNGQQGDWLYMGFTGIDGSRVGSQIMVPPSSRRDGWAWYSANNEQLPFYYFSPAYLFYKPLVLKKGEQLNLNYRILHHSGETGKQELQIEYQKYESTPKSQLSTNGLK